MELVVVVELMVMKLYERYVEFAVVVAVFVVE